MTIKLTVFDQVGIGYETETEASMEDIESLCEAIPDLRFLKVTCTNGTIAYVYTPASIEIASQESDQ